MIRRLLTSATVLTSAAAGITGISFMLANLALARALDVDEFATVVLAVTLLNFGLTLAPCGQERIAIRHHLTVGRKYLLAGHGSSMVVACLFVVAALALYDLNAATVVIIGLGIIAGGSVQLAAGVLLAERWHMVSMLTTQGHNIILLMIAIGCLIVGPIGASTIMLLLLAALVAVAATAWHNAARLGTGSSDYRLNWREALGLTGMMAFTTALNTLERLMIPLLLGTTSLAQFAVVSSLVMAPFRLLQIGLARSLLSELHHGQSVAERRRLLFRELCLLGVYTLVLAVGLWWLSAPVAHYVFHGKYEFSQEVVAAAIFVGAVRMTSSVGTTALTALGSVRQLGVGGIVCTLAFAIAVIGGIVGASFGLAGLMLGVGCGWLVQGIACAWVIRKAIR